LISPLFPYTTLFRSLELFIGLLSHFEKDDIVVGDRAYGSYVIAALLQSAGIDLIARLNACRRVDFRKATKKLGRGEGLFNWKKRSEEHTSELQSLRH